MNGDHRIDDGPHVVIVGGGFGGLYAARALAGAPVRVTLVDQHNHHLFQPLLYQVATAALNPSDIATPIRRILRRQRNAAVILGTVTAVDVAARRVILVDGTIPYDYLILAPGATHTYFGREEWVPHAPGLKTIVDALEIRRRLLIAYEAAERETDAGRRQEWMTFVIIGGGPTGVELAGAFGEIARRVLERDFRNIDPRDSRVVLVEAGPRVLGTYPPDLSEHARRHLQRLGVDIVTGASVTAIDASGVGIGDRHIGARTVLWAAGVAASPLARSLGAPLDRAGRVIARPDLTVPGAPGVYAIGDMAAVELDGAIVPGVAPAAMQEGRHAARNILRALEGRAPEPFHYYDKGMLATIGRAAAVARIGRFAFHGFTAWLVWLVVHIVWLIGFRNRMLVLLQWAWLYLRNERGARLIPETVESVLTPERVDERAPQRG